MGAPETARELDAELFRDVIGHFPSGVTVVTTALEGRRLGTTASAVASLSLDPPMLLVCLKRDSTTRAAVRETGRFAVNILSERQDALAARFATKQGSKFDGLPPLDGPAGMPLLEGALASIECEVEDEVSGGTHSVFLGRALAAAARQGRPLAYFRGRFGRLELDEEPPPPATPAPPQAPDEVTVRSAIDAKHAIEIGAAAIAAKRAGATELAALRQLNERLQERGLAGPTTLRTWLEEDGRFHERLVALTGSADLVAAHRAARAHRAMAAMAQGESGERPVEPGLIRACCEDHRLALSALESGDAAMIAAVTKHHLDPFVEGEAADAPR